MAAVWFLLLQSLFLIGSPTEYPMDAKFVEMCVNQHNRHRSAVNPGASNMHFMSWDAGLAKTAKAWSKTCSSAKNPHLERGDGHPSFDTVGENSYIASGTISIVDAIQSWNDEGTHFDFANNLCAKKYVCKHYTQLVWGETYKLGCAANHCSKGINGSKIKDGAIFVCNYSPSGNVEELTPYHKGAPCTACGADFCRSFLCSDPYREEIAQYPDWNPDFGSASVLLSNCLLTLLPTFVIYILWS
ncbi:GLIPR1-like protein 1 [Scyliorhinus torazame]|uniref:GLIPR1-like protein 1 n=1 Tax=Scyliorhinus torazame TaxID=75743 RepID=UPI003B590FAA